MTNADAKRDSPGQCRSALMIPLPPPREARGSFDRYRPCDLGERRSTGRSGPSEDEHKGLDVALKIVDREGKAAARARAREYGRGPAAQPERSSALPRFGANFPHVYIRLRGSCRGGTFGRSPRRRAETRSSKWTPAARCLRNGWLTPTPPRILPPRT